MKCCPRCNYKLKYKKNGEISSKTPDFINLKVRNSNLWVVPDNDEMEVIACPICGVVFVSRIEYRYNRG